MPMTAVMLVIFVTMVGFALGYPPQSRFLPLVIGIPGIVLSLVQLFQDLRGPRPSGEWKTNVRRELVLFGYFVGLVAGVLLFGFWLTIPVFLIVFLRLHERDSWMFAISLTAASWLVIYLIFDQLLGIVLHAGFLTEYLRG